MNLRSWFRPSGSVVSTLLLASCGFALSAAPMQAQVVAPTTAVGQMSAPQPATVTITTAGTLSQIAVVTQGATGKDFTEAAGDNGAGTCTALLGNLVTIGQTCTVQYTFSPKHPRIRYGGISLSDASGVLLGNLYLTGNGTAAQVTFPPSATTVPATLIGNTAGTSVGIVVDGNGNVYFTDASNGFVKEIVAVGGVIPASPTVNTLATGFGFPRAIAIDGSGNLFVADSSANVVKEIVAVGGAIPASPVIRTVGSGFSTPSGVAVDGNGNLYVADSNNAAVKQVVAENGVISTSPTINSLATGVDATGIAVDAAGDIFFTNGSAEIDELAVETGSPVKVATVANLIGLAIDGAGDLYVPDNINKAVYEIVAVGGVIPANPTPVTLGTGFSSPNGVAVDGAGNVFVADSGSVDEFSVQTPPTVTFTSTAAGTTSSDSPMILTVGNNGNVDLHFTSANTTAGFSVDIGSPCNIGGAPIGKNCTYSISFDPLAIGPVSGSLTLQNNNLNDANGAGTQVVPLAGGVASPTIAVPDVSAAVDTTAVPLSATITYDGVMPNVTGTVTFTVNGLPAGGITATCTGAASPLTCTATYDDSSLAAGGAGYKIVANFAGDTSNNPEMGSGTLTVNPGTPGMTLVTSGSPATVDTPLTFTATVTPNTGTIIPTGTVSFTSTLGAGSPTAIAANCTNVSLTAGVATCTTADASALAAGSYTITANLAADTNFIAQSATVAQTVTQATPVVVVTTSNNSVPVNGSITFTATVTPNTGITPGTVSFTSTLGAGSPTAIAANCTNVSLTAGSATCTTSALNAGSYTITATVPADGNFNQASGNVPQAVTPVTPVVVLTTTDAAPTVNGPVTLTATVTPNAGIVPNGTVTFTTTLGASTTTLCSSVALVPGTGPTLTATCPTTTLQAGTNSIGASLAADTGDTNFAAATATAITENVSPGTPVLTTTSSVTGTSPLNGSVTFTTTVTPNSGITPVGGVSFTMMLPGGSTLPIAANCTGVGLQNVAGALTATCTTTLLNAGANSIVASIAFDSNFNAASAPAIIQNVSQGTPVLSLNTAPGVVTVNGLATITATVTPNAGVVPSGTLVFTTTLNGTTTPIAACTAVPLVAASGPSLTATCKTAALQAGGNAINASFAGDSNFVPATITDGILQTINTATITLAVVSSGSPSVVDQPVTFTATLSSALSFTTVPTGTVTFRSNGNDIPGCEARPVSATDQTATCTTSSLVAFPDLIVVNYVSGDFNFNNVNDAAPITQTVNKDATATAVISSAPTTAVVNQTVTFTATITPSAPGVASPTSVPITGNVTFTQGVGGTVLCNVGVTSIGDGTATAACSAAFTTAFASTAIVTKYLGDTNFTASTSNVLQTVGAAPTTTTVASQKNPSQVNDSVTLTATVIPTNSGAAFPGNTTPLGTVSFSDSLDVAGSPFCPNTPVSGAPSPVSCNHIFLTQGNHVITATFTPSDSNFATSTSTGITQLVNASGTTGIQVGTTTPTLTVDQSATFTAIFTPTVTGTQPAGTVSYFDAALITPSNTTGAIPTCPAVTVTAAGTIPNCVETMLAAGTHNISAVFTPQTGNLNFPIITSPLFPQSVAQNTTSVALTAPTVPSVVDQVVTFTANVTQGTLTPAGTGTTTPSGTITFTYTGGAAPICSAPVSTTTGVATCTAPFTAPATYNVTATYSGDTNFKTSASTPTFPEVVSKASTSVGLSGASLSTPASPAVNQLATYSVLISVAAPAIDTAAGASVPTGTVTFNYVLNGGASTLLCSGPVSTAGGVTTAGCTAPLAVAGTYTITANYSGDGNFNTSTATFQQTIGLSATTTIIPNPPVTPTITPTVNQPVTLNATVAPVNAGSKVPTGTVTFTDSSTGNPTLTCVTTLTASGVAGCPYNFTTSGTHTLTATYSGDANFSPSDTNSLPVTTVTVSAAGAFSVVVGTTTPSVIVDQAATFTASFSPQPTGTQPSGTVSYSDGATVICTNLVVKADGTIPNCTETVLTAGTHNITANYSGDSNFTTLKSLAFPQSVAQNTTSVALTAPTAPSVVDQVVTFTANVTQGTLTPPGMGTTTPSGTITFTYTGGATPICSASVSTTTGVATCTAPFTAPATYIVTANYSGDTNFQTSASATHSQVVNAAGTSVAFSGSTPPSPAVNQPATYTVQISPVSPANDAPAGSAVPTGTVSFSYVLNGVTTALCSPAPAVSTTGGVSSASCTGPIAVAGTYTITATYSSDTNFGASQTTFSQTIGLSATTTNIATPPVTPTITPAVNQSVTLNATVAPVNAGSKIPTGSVTFTDRNLPNPDRTCVVALSANGSAGCPYTFTTSGTHTLTASYSGDLNFSPSSSSLPGTTVTVGAAGLSVVVATTTASPVVNQPATFTASFSPQPNGTQPQGTVAYYDSLVGGGTTPICSGPGFNVVNGVIPSCTETMFLGGNHSITAAFKTGDLNFQDITSAAFIQAVGLEGTILGPVTATPASPAVGASAPYSVQISLAGGTKDAANPTEPTGFVTFTDDASPLVTCSVKLTMADKGLASCHLTEATQGSHMIDVSYVGDGNFSPSPNASSSVTIGAAPLNSLVFGSGNNPSIATQQVTFTATASGLSTGAAPGGVFTFHIAGNATATPDQCVPNTATIDVVGKSETQSCTVTFPSTASGPFQVSLSYSTDTNYQAASATPVTQTVLNFTPTISLAANPLAPVTLSQATVVSGVNSFSNTSLTDPFLQPQTTKVTIAPLGGTSSDTYAVTGCVLVPMVTDLTCAPTTPDPTTKVSTGVVFTTTGDATTSALVGVYTARVTITDTNVSTLSQTATLQVAVIARPNTVFVGSVGSATTTFKLPVASSSALSCDGSNVQTVNQDGTYSTVAGASTFAQLGIACSVSGPDAAGVYKVTITAGQQPSAKLETGHSAVIAATLGAPFLLLFGLLPAFRKQRKLLVRSLGMFLMAIAILQTTGCGGGSFGNPNQNIPSATTGSYLIRIVNPAGATVAEIPVFISNGRTN